MKTDRASNDQSMTANPGKRRALHVVIPVFNGWDSTRKCLEALRQVAEPLRIIVVDHGSTDATKTDLPLLFPDVEIVFGDDSLWWSGATNLGIRAALAAGADAVVLLNNDCYVDQNTIGTLLAHHDRNPQAIIAPRQRDASGQDGHVERVTTCLTLGFSTFMLPASFAPTPDSGGLMHVKLIAGGRGTLIPASVFNRAGLLDEVSLPHYFADHDFYLRCRKLGVPLCVAADAWVTIDATRTSLAATGIPASISALHNMLWLRRSHRNIEAQSALFKKHYPVGILWRFGVFLFYLRYFLLFAVEPLRRKKRPKRGMQRTHDG